MISQFLPGNKIIQSNILTVYEKLCTKNEANLFPKNTTLITVTAIEPTEVHVGLHLKSEHAYSGLLL